MEGLEAKGTQGKKNCLFNVIEKYTGENYLFNANLLHQLIYAGTHFRFKQ